MALVEKPEKKRARMNEKDETVSEAEFEAVRSSFASASASTGNPTSIKLQHELELPTDLWAHVCHFLPYSDVKHVAAVSKTMLEQVMPCILTVHLFSPEELNVCHAQKRLTHVERVNVYCLLRDRAPLPGAANNTVPPGWSLQYSPETSHRIIPYLQSVAHLRHVFLGAMAVWQGRNRRAWNGNTDETMAVKPTYVADTDCDARTHHSILVNAMCGALAAKAFSASRAPIFQLEGLFHAQAPRYCVRRQSPPPPCETCRQIVRHFPSSWLLQISGNKSLCVSPRELLQSIIQRGHGNLLRDEAYIARLVKDAFVEPLPGFICFHVGDTLKALEELKMIQLINLDPTLFYQALKDAKQNSTSPVPAKLVREDFHKMVELGIRMDQQVLERDFGVALHSAEASNEGSIWSAAEFLNRGDDLQRPGAIAVPPFGLFLHPQQGHAGPGFVHVEINGVAANGIDYPNVLNRVRNAMRGRFHDNGDGDQGQFMERDQLLEHARRINAAVAAAADGQAAADEAAAAAAADGQAAAANEAAAAERVDAEEQAAAAAAASAVERIHNIMRDQYPDHGPDMRQVMDFDQLFEEAQQVAAAAAANGQSAPQNNPPVFGPPRPPIMIGALAGGGGHGGIEGFFGQVMMMPRGRNENNDPNNEQVE